MVPPPSGPRDTEDSDEPKIGLAPGIPTKFTFITPVKCSEQNWLARRVVADDVPNGPAAIEFWLSATDNLFRFARLVAGQCTCTWGRRGHSRNRPTVFPAARLRRPCEVHV